MANLGTFVTLSPDELDEQQQQSFADCAKLIEAIPTMSPELFTAIKRLAAHNSKFLAERGDEVSGQMYRKLFTLMTEHQLKEIQ
jgi:uncharacterized protein Yka (UPF0111/DUF47 family)